GTIRAETGVGRVHGMSLTFPSAIRHHLGLDSLDSNFAYRTKIRRSSPTVDFVNLASTNHTPHAHTTRSWSTLAYQLTAVDVYDTDQT
ncbi:11730_t:CDS:1, partial [Acaulospora colombiana]